MSFSPYFYELENVCKEAIRSEEKDAIEKRKRQVETEFDCQEISADERDNLLALFDE